MRGRAQAGRHARVVFGERALDLAVIDLGVRTLGGELLATELQRLQPGLAVIFTTGGAVPDQLEQLAGPILAKPFTLDVLARCRRIPRGRRLR